jgi:Tol biopolymer transport system component
MKWFAPALVILATPAMAADPVQVLNVGEKPTVSPDGLYIAFEDGNGISKAPAAGGSVTPLVSGGIEPDSEPDWGPGSLIVYRNGNALITVDATTMATSVIVDSGGYDDNPAWSPDGTEIVIEGSIVIVSYPGGSLSTVPCTGSECQGENPSWSNNGWIAFKDGPDIVRLPRSGGTPEIVVGGSGNLSNPAWSPDGKWIAFAMSTTSSTHIWVANAWGTNSFLTQITTGPYFDGSPAWSPDSQTIYFASNRGSAPGFSRSIWKVDLGQVITEPATWGKLKTLYGTK